MEPQASDGCNWSTRPGMAIVGIARIHTMLNTLFGASVPFA